ncbi:MAG: hypothetical protein ABI999_01730 [Acidobacteriota bacterium]
MLIHLFLLSVICGGVGSVQAQKIKVVRDPESASILTIKKAGSDLPSGDLAEKVEKDSAGKSTLTLTADKRYEASVFCVPSGSSEMTGCVHRVFITDLQSDAEYEIVGEELFIESGRMIDNLKWQDSHTLSYERWTGPHFGHRYVVDIKALKQTAAFTLSDQ